jgi:hypothetical protein
MKHSIMLALLLAPGLSVLAQTGTDTARSPVADAGALNDGQVVHKLKSNDAVLPRWAFDLNYRFGLQDQNIEMVNLAQSYTGSLSSSRYMNPKYIDGQSNGGDAALVYFFNRRRTIGISLGGQYIRHTGTLVMDSMYADYRQTLTERPYPRRRPHYKRERAADLPVQAPVWQRREAVQLRHHRRRGCGIRPLQPDYDTKRFRNVQLRGCLQTFA